MGLKATIAKADYDSLDANLKKLYTPAGDGYALDVEGGIVSSAEVLDLKTKLGEFRDNNRTMFSELETLRPLKDKYKDIDPEEVKRLKALEQDLKNKGVEPNKLQDFIANEIAKHTKPLADQLAAEAKAREAAQQRADQARFRELVQEPATKAGVNAKGLRHVLRDAEDIYALGPDKNSLIPKEGVKHPTEPHKDYTPDEWLAHLAKTDPYLFTPSNGGGADGGNRIGQQGAKELLNPTAEEMGKHVDDLATGKMVVVRR